MTKRQWRTLPVKHPKYETINWQFLFLFIDSLIIYSGNCYGDEPTRLPTDADGRENEEHQHRLCPFAAPETDQH